MIDQVGIVGLGVTAVGLSQSKTYARYACLFGMASQPFWIYSAVSAAQWGVLVATLFYTAAWASGIWKFWLAPEVRL